MVSGNIDEYDWWSLQPKDQSERLLFRQFRNKDVKEQFKYFLAAVAVIVVYMAFNLLRTR